MIPKVIHWCWFGRNPLPDDVKRYIASWKKYLPDYEIKCWNEGNFDVNSCEYVQEAYSKKKYAFVSDYVRLYALVNYGGIYMDSNVEVVKPLDPFLSHKAFSGFQDENTIPTGIIASEADFPLFRELLDDYKQRHFINSNGSLNKTTNVDYITNSLLKKGLELNNSFQIVDGLALYPSDVFCAKSLKNGKLFANENTFTIHHFAGSWLSSQVKARIKRRRSLTNKYGHIGLLLYWITNWPYKIMEKIKRE